MNGLGNKSSPSGSSFASAVLTPPPRLLPSPLRASPAKPSRAGSPARGPETVWLPSHPKPRRKTLCQPVPLHPPTLRVPFPTLVPVAVAPAGRGMLLLTGSRPGTEGKTSRMTNLARSSIPARGPSEGASRCRATRDVPPAPAWLAIERAEAHPVPSFQEPKAPTPAPLKSWRETGKDNETRPEKTERASEALAAFLAFLEFNH